LGGREFTRKKNGVYAGTKDSTADSVKNSLEEEKEGPKGQQVGGTMLQASSIEGTNYNLRTTKSTAARNRRNAKKSK